MGALGEYILSVTAAALITSLLCCIPETKPLIMSTRLLCGLLLALTVLRPIGSFDIQGAIRDTFRGEAQLGEKYRDAGSKIAADAIEDIILETTQTYIVDKATQLGADISAEVTLKDGVPIAVTVSGAVSPGIRRQLETFLEQDFGITKEHQQWI